VYVHHIGDTAIVVTAPPTDGTVTPGATIRDRLIKELPSAAGLFAQDSSCPPVWRQDDRCYACEKVFGWGYGLYETVHRHHCRNCGRSGCCEHVKNFLPIQRLGLDEPQRVCDECAVALMPAAASFEASDVSAANGDAVCASASIRAEKGIEAARSARLLTEAISSMSAALTAKSHDTAAATAALAAIADGVTDRHGELGRTIAADRGEASPEASGLRVAYVSPRLQKLAAQQPEVDRLMAAADSARHEYDVKHDEVMAATRLACDAVLDELGSARALASVDKLGPADGGSGDRASTISTLLARMRAAADRLNRLEVMAPPDAGVAASADDASTLAVADVTEQQECFVELHEARHSLDVQVQAALDNVDALHAIAMATASHVLPQLDALRSLHDIEYDGARAALAAAGSALHAWFTERDAMIDAAHARDAALAGNLNHRLNQKLNRALEDKAELAARLQDATTALAQAGTADAAAPGSTSSAVGGVDQAAPAADTELRTEIGRLERANAALAEQIQHEREAAAKRESDAQEVRTKLLNSMTQLTDEREALAMHAAELRAAKTDADNEARTTAKLLAAYHAASVRTHGLLHPAGGRPDDVPGTPTQTFAAAVAQLVADATSNHSRLQAKFEERGVELVALRRRIASAEADDRRLRQQPERRRQQHRAAAAPDAGQTADTTTPAPARTSVAVQNDVPSVICPDLTRDSAAVAQLRMMGFSEPAERLLQAVRDADGEVELACAILTSPGSAITASA